MIRRFSHEQEVEEHTDEFATINIIPLVDIMLVLLVIFMITAPLSLSSIKVHLPSSNSTQSLQKEPKVILSIDEKGHFFMGKEKISKGSLEDRVRNVFSKKQDKVLYVFGDKAVNYGSVVEAINLAKNAGVAKVAMITAKKSKN
ncbi:MAG: protein TolR [Zetaproteobacteria bacterium]|nr:protein TolR [Pseudobdellovibrionaceae bacterium]|tara:strand:- start:307 stop:738 length:432 start_codon:yes stop_codon:yes gene_type:complete